MHDAVADAAVSHHRRREWLVAPPFPRRDALAAALGVSPLVAQLLIGRGVDEPGLAERFLSPQFSDLQPPETLPGAVDAARLLWSAIRAGRKIVIYGDYDVDGVTATTILWHVIRDLGGVVESYVPNRLEEGYGLNSDAIRAIGSAGAALVITVDCGITAIEEAALAKALGIELIITDHHEPRAQLPQARAIVHPTACGASPNPHLSGAGVALKVAWALARGGSGDQERVAPRLRDRLIDATAFAAMGLIADVVPLTGENRVIAHFGLRQLSRVANPGLEALIRVSGLDRRRDLDDFDIGYKLAPRLNAVGRLGHAREAVELFTTADTERAARLATEIDQLNRERQEVERRIVKEAEALVIERGFHRDGCRGIVLAREGWHAGVIGIVASRLVDRFCRPTVLIALENGIGQGSGRSVPDFALHEALEACAPHLNSHGGHAMAAGLRVSTGKIELFTSEFQRVAAERLTDRDLRPRLKLDDEVSLAQLDAEAVRCLQRMAPHGPGNVRPRLATTPVDLAEPPRLVGRSGQHLQVTVRQGGVYRRAIAFGFGPQRREIAEHRTIRLAFEPTLNEWQGRVSAELRVIDWQPSAADGAGS